MTKKFLRSLTVGFCVFVATAIVAAIAYTSAVKTAGSAVRLSQTEQPVTAAPPEPLSAADVIAADYYLARCEGGSIAIYACSDGGEEFLYTIDVRIEDIPPDELALLRSGITLTDRHALASFEEDFGS